MPTERTRLEVSRLRSYVHSKNCASIGCKARPAPGFSLCLTHRNAQRRHGVLAASPLSLSARRVYVRAARTFLAYQLRRKDITVLSAVNHLSAYIERHCLAETFRPSDLGRRGISGLTKSRSILHALYRRFGNNPDITALAVLSVAVGTAIACRTEPNCSRHPTFEKAAIASALWSMCLTPTVTNSVGTYKLHRPKLTGPRLREAINKIVTQPYVRWLLTRDNTRAILQHVLTNQYGELKWQDWQKRTEYSFTKGFLSPGYVHPNKGRKGKLLK